MFELAFCDFLMTAKTYLTSVSRFTGPSKLSVIARGITEGRLETVYNTVSLWNILDLHFSRSLQL